VEPHISCIRSISVIRREAKMDEESIGNLLRIGASVLICITIYSFYKLLRGD